MNTTLLPNVTNTHHLSLVQIIIFHQTTSICDQNPGQPCSIKAGTLHHLKLMNRLRCFRASLIYYKLLALGSSMFSQILCQQIANELEKKLLWTGNSLKCSNFISRNYFLEDLWLGIQKELFLFDCTFRKLGSWMNINWLFVNSVYMVCIFLAVLASFIPAFSFYINIIQKMPILAMPKHNWPTEMIKNWVSFTLFLFSL